MADYDKWRKALGDAATLRVQQDTAKRALDAASAERDRVFLAAGRDSSAFRNAQAQVTVRQNEVNSFNARIQAADATAAFEEPTQAVKRDRICDSAMRARQMGTTPAVQVTLDRQCRDLGGDPTATPIFVTNAAPVTEAPLAVSPARNLLLPIAAAVGLAAVAGGVYYFWSLQRRTKRVQTRA